MLIKQIKKETNDGKLEVTFALTEEQTQLLLEFAINMLVGKGLVTFTEEAMVESKEDNTMQQELDLNEAMAEVMREAKPSDLPQA